MSATHMPTQPERREAAANDTDPYEVLCQRGPFAGFTIAKAELLQDALGGREVLIEGHYGESRGIFNRILLPGESPSTIFCQAYDLEILTGWHGRKCGFGSSRHICIGAVKRLVIGPEYGFCEDCCHYVPKTELWDLATIETTGLAHRMCCRHMDNEGRCL